MIVQKQRGNKKSNLVAKYPQKDRPTNKDLNEQEQNLIDQNQLKNVEFPFLAHRYELTYENIFFIAIKLTNNQYIYEWFRSKEKASCLYSYVLKFDENIRNRNFFLVDNDNGKVVESEELISNTLKSLNKGNSRTRFSLSVKFEAVEQ